MNKYDDTDYQIEREESIEYEEDSVYAHKFAIMQKQINEKEKKIKELEEQLEKANKQLDLDYVDKNYIPKEKVKNKIEDLQYNNSLGFEETLEETFKIEVLQELLEDQ